jgi:ribonuclease HI
MKQQTLFPPEAPYNKQPLHLWKVYIDGASRNNPGPAGAGIYILQDENPLYSYGFYVGKKTNNQAEYLALLLALFYIRQLVYSTDNIHIFSDSQLLIRQLEGAYQVKHAELKPLHRAARILLAPLRYTATHILREENSIADSLANEGIDKKNPVPPEFIKMLELYEIPWNVQT